MSKLNSVFNDMTGIKRGDFYYCYPEELALNPNNTRAYGHTDGQIKSLLADIVERGQLQPIVISPDITIDGKPLVEDGNGRVQAILAYNDGKPIDARMKVKVVLGEKGLDESAITLNSIAANLKRSDLTIVDHAKNVAFLLDKLGKTPAEVASFYGKSDAWVSQTRKLWDLPAKRRRQIHEGILTAAVAWELFGLTEEEQDTILARVEEHAPVVAKKSRKAAESNGDDPVAAEPVKEITADAVRSEKRRLKEEKGETEKKARRINEVKGLFQALLTDYYYTEEDCGRVRTFAKEFLKYINGDLTDQQIVNRIVKACAYNDQNEDLLAKRR